MRAQTELLEGELHRERREIARVPETEQAELAAIYHRRGVPEDDANRLAEIMMSDPEVALETHAREELGVDPESLGNPFGAALSSFVAFAIGAVLPIIPWLFLAGNGAIITSLTLALLGAAGMGIAVAYMTHRHYVRSTFRHVAFAAGAAGLTYLIGSFFDAAA